MSDSEAASEKLWGGRFGKSTEKLMEQFNASIGFDQRLYKVDIEGSRAQAKALTRIGVLAEKERDEVIAGLDQVEAELDADDLPLTDDLEDIHMAVEKRLIELVGDAGAKIHTGRSRNDQVALDERLYFRQVIDETVGRIDGLMQVLLNSAEEHIDVILPGYTHVQQAQPIRFGHYTMALFWMLERDRGRFVDSGKRADAMPLGAGALAGSAYPVDREFVRETLGFARVTDNSIDSVSDRDYFLEFMSAAAILMGHLSRFCEDVIMWSSSEFGFVELDDAFSTGSSMMPQKKNPDSLELVRGKTGRVYGNLMSLLTVMKAIPLTYAKDMQEDKEPFFDTVDTLQISLDVFAGAWDTMTVKGERMEAALDGMILATDLADYLVRKGVPFRTSHRIVGELVRKALDRGIRLEALDMETLHAASDVFDDDIKTVLSPVQSTAQRNLYGGTGRESVAKQIEAGNKLLIDRNGRVVE
ncbi:MAG: argininosuccinate lyase [Candidatus Latescibacteria bacterium]|nr:argininosuccinate lyase [Candidatus Latescibacterota bacterium]